MSSVVIEIGLLRNRFDALTTRIETKPGDRVLVASSEGLNTATVVSGAYPEKPEKKDKYEWKIIRTLTKEDYRILEENRAAADDKTAEVKEEIRKENLNMNLTRLSYTYDRSKMYVYYTAEGRVDFRNLIRKLGSKLKIRIQMVQIGVRDEAAMLGGIGLCGREICCSRFLRNIETVNIDMARNQNLVQNTENISGCCGRLLCCLRFEEEFYRKACRNMPCVGKKVQTPSGKGTVAGVDPVKETVKVNLKIGGEKEFKADSVSPGIKERFKKWIK